MIFYRSFTVLILSLAILSCATIGEQTVDVSSDGTSCFVLSPSLEYLAFPKSQEALSLAVHAAWDGPGGARELLVRDLSKELNVRNTVVLYNFQGFTYALLEYAIAVQDNALLGDLGSLFDYIFSFADLDDNRIGWPNFNFHGADVVLYTGQYLSEVSCFVAYVASEEEAQVDLEAKRIADEYWQPMIGTYKAWLLGPADYQIAKVNALSAQAFGKYPDIITDREVLIAIGCINLLIANRENPIDFPISESLLAVISGYVESFSALLVKRSTLDFDGGRAHLSIDQGGWSDYIDFRYAGYEEDSYPEGMDPVRVSSVGWDLSHARRFVPLKMAWMRWFSFDQDGPAPYFNWKAFTAQILDRVFLGDYHRPRFANYLDGSNGWYRVGYSGRKNFGYPPSSLTSTFSSGGYFLLYDDERDLQKIAQGVWREYQEARMSPSSSSFYKPSVLFETAFYASLNPIVTAMVGR